MDTLFANLLNRLLADQPGALQRLAMHAGKRLHIVLPVAAIALRITPDGRFAAAAEADDAAQDDACEISLPAHVLAQLPLQGGAALSAARVSGDGVLASDLSALLQRLDWALLLAPYVGPIAAARADQALRGLARWQAEAREALARSAAEYLVHEARLLADGQAVRELVAAADELRDAAARLEARLAVLESRGRPT